jgi:hypothetical protein
MDKFKQEMSFVDHDESGWMLIISLRQKDLSMKFAHVIGARCQTKIV